jgi:hypothetical protein
VRPHQPRAKSLEHTNSGDFASGGTCHTITMADMTSATPSCRTLGLLQLPYQLVLCASCARWRLIAAWVHDVKQRSILRAPQPVGAGNLKLQSCGERTLLRAASLQMHGGTVLLLGASSHACRASFAANTGTAAHLRSGPQPGALRKSNTACAAGRCLYASGIWALLPSCSKRAVFASLRTELSAQSQLCWSDCARIEGCTMLHNRSAA